jgi:hypothetical protein
MADRYWVGAGTNWNDTASWSDVSAGSSGFSVPTSADNAFFDASSGNAVINAAGSCLDLDCTGYTGTMTHNDAINISVYGNFKLVAGMTYTILGGASTRWTFSATATGKTVDTGGKAMPSPVEELKP